MADHLVKLVHARDLARWERIPAYEQHDGKRLATHRAEVKARESMASQLWRLLDARRLLDRADQPQVYRTATLRSPWPITLPGWRSLPLDAVAHPETTFETELGSVESGRLRLPLFIRERRFQVRYLAPERVTSPQRVAEARANLASASRAELETLQAHLATPAPERVLFISHRWLSPRHPDPEGHQLRQLKALKDCYVIYDYASFPQDTATPAARNALRQVLDGMNGFIDNVLVLADPDYMRRGWCLYEYIVGSLAHRIVCDEINDPSLVRLRNLVATDPSPPGIGSTYREARNAKSELVLKAVNAVLPVFGRGEFTLDDDRAIVRRLLIAQLLRSLPKKQEYVPYVGEWKTSAWTEKELAAAFESAIKWEALQFDPSIPIFEPAVPDTVAGAVAAGYAIEHQPKGFGSERYNLLDLSDIGRLVFFFRAGALAVIVLLVWALYRFVHWLLA